MLILHYTVYEFCSRRVSLAAEPRYCSQAVTCEKNPFTCSEYVDSVRVHIFTETRQKLFTISRIFIGNFCGISALKIWRNCCLILCICSTFSLSDQNVWNSQIFWTVVRHFIQFLWVYLLSSSLVFDFFSDILKGWKISIWYRATGETEGESRLMRKDGKCWRRCQTLVREILNSNILYSTTWAGLFLTFAMLKVGVNEHVSGYRIYRKSCVKDI